MVCMYVCIYVPQSSGGAFAKWLGLAPGLNGSNGSVKGEEVAREGSVLAGPEFS